MLDEIVAGLKALLATHKVEREAWEEKERARQDLIRRHDLAKKRAERDKNRQNFLQLLIQRQSEVIHLRDCLSRLMGSGQDDELGRFVGWIRSYVSELEQMISPAGLAQEIKIKELFPAVDPLYDPLGEPPPINYYGW